MKLSDNFTLEEMTASATARRRGIDNTPTEQALVNLKKLATDVLQPIREAWGGPIVVGSGYRCLALNKAVKGASNSDHLYGAAADIHTQSDRPEENKRLFELILQLAESGRIECRQIIDEYRYNWIHVSVNHNRNRRRKNQVLHIR